MIRCAVTVSRHSTATLDRTPQKIAPGCGITPKWAVLWPKWPCPKVPFPLRAKRARKAQNGTGTVPSRDGFANFSRRLLDFRMTSCPVGLSASCRPGSPRTSRITKCNFHDFRDFCFRSATNRQPPLPLLGPLGESYVGVGGWRKVPLWPKKCGVTPKTNGYKTPKFALVA